MKDELKIKTYSKTVAEVYHFVFDVTGWATFTICESTGEFSIQSDWGNYSHRWNINAIGTETLKAFIAKCDPHYLADKFSYSKSRDFKNTFDVHKTIDSLTWQIKESRKDDELEHGRARELYNLVKKLDMFDDANEFYQALDSAPESYFEYDNEPNEAFCYRPSFEYEFLIGKLLPFFIEHLRAEGDNK